MLCFVALGQRPPPSYKTLFLVLCHAVTGYAAMRFAAWVYGAIRIEAGVYSVAPLR